LPNLQFALILLNHAEFLCDIDVNCDRLPLLQRRLESPLPNRLNCGVVIVFTKGTFDLNLVSTAIGTDDQP
jgi:hypothetical protein